MKKITYSIFVFTFLCIYVINAQTPKQTTATNLTNNKIPVRMTLTNMAKTKPLPNETILFVNQKTKKETATKTNKEGKTEVALEKGFIYDVKFRATGGDTYDYGPLEIENNATGFTLTLQYEPPRNFELKNVEFDSGKATLKPVSFAALGELIELMKLKPTTEIEIRGHTDNVGTPAANLKLSEARAKAVVDYVILKGIDKKRLTFKGFGDTQPKNSNDTPQNRQKNRRTEASVTKD